MTDHARNHHPSGHKVVVCRCGVRLSTCRCMGPKTVLVSAKPCTHVKPGLVPALAEDKSSYIQPTLVGFGE